MKTDFSNYLKLVAKTIQTNYSSQDVARSKFIELLEETDRLHESFFKEKIIRRETPEEKRKGRNILNYMAGYNPLDKLQ